MTDYQFVEHEVDGMTRLTLRVSPTVGPLSEADVLEVVFHRLDSDGKMMAELWRRAGTVGVARETPLMTTTGKVLPLESARAAQAAQSAASAQ